MISIIVAVYNTEKYLARCMDSIIAQTYKDFEVIVIDDGSTDSSPFICDSYAHRDERIRVIHRKNGGLSVARNEGLKLAKGDFIIFADSDDYLTENALELLVDVQKKNKCDLVIGGYTRVYDDGKMIVCGFPFEEKVREISEKEFWNLSIDNMSAIVAWGKLYSKEILEGIIYPEGKINEDMAVLLDIVKKCHSIFCLNESLVFYQINNSSIMHSKFKLKNLDDCEFRLNIIKHLIDNSLYNVAIFYWKYAARTLVRAYRELELDETGRDRLRKLRVGYKSVVFKLLKAPGNIGFKAQMILYRISFPCYCALFKLMGKEYNI